jgi:hypothetical protein
MSPPLWLTRPIAPSPSVSVFNTTEEHSAMWWCGTMKPMQFGPTMRMPVRAAMSTSFACCSAPPLLASAKPVEMMTQQPTPLSAASLTVCTSRSGGTARIATSGALGTSAMRG